MKMNHHGIGSGNSVSLLEAVQPSYAFIPNTGVSETDAKTNKWRTGTAIKRMTSYHSQYGKSMFSLHFPPNNKDHKMSCA